VRSLSRQLSFEIQAIGKFPFHTQQENASHKGDAGCSGFSLGIAGDAGERTPVIGIARPQALVLEKPMSKLNDIYLRAHTVVLATPQTDRETQNQLKPLLIPVIRRKWADEVLVFDCESRTDSGQELTFGFYRALKLINDNYELVEEGGFFDDDLPTPERVILESYADTAETEVKNFPPQFPLYPRSEFVKAILYKMARRGAMIVGFNICFDLARLARRWPEGKKNEWSLVLVEYPDGNENLNYPYPETSRHCSVIPHCSLMGPLKKVYPLDSV